MNYYHIKDTKKIFLFQERKNFLSSPCWDKSYLDKSLVSSCKANCLSSKSVHKDGKLENLPLKNYGTDHSCRVLIHDQFVIR
jgi:hypothetical protein